MRLDVKKQLSARSERVKGVDFHPTEPWILTTLYTGNVTIWSYETQAIVKSFELTDVPVRAGRFIARKNWIVCGSDDFQLRVYNYNTSEKVAAFEAHPDYIRAIVVHPTQPFVLTASDDMTIKLWDWEKNWKCVQVFEGHAHYVMGLSINPKDTNTFASACLDRTVKIWSLGSSVPNFTLDAHEVKGVNYVEYYPQSDKPYLLTTSDDRTVKVWDYTNKSVVATLEGHSSNVSFACYHPELPLIISGSEDGTIKIWNANTYRLEQTLNYGLERAWCVSYQKGKNGIAFGFDEGAVVVKMGRDEPAVSMDASGKVIWAKNLDIMQTVIKAPEPSLKDGDRLILQVKDLGATEVYAQTLLHSPNGRFVAICGDGEYTVYTALALRNQTFGNALDFGWGSKENDKDFVIRESPVSVKLFRNLKERPEGALDVGFSADALFGGSLISVVGQGGVGLFDWNTMGLVCRIEVEPRNVFWSESGDLVALACDEVFYVLRFNRDVYLEAYNNGEVTESGVESAIEMITDINETVQTGQWVGDAFLYTTTTNRLKYLVGSSTHTLAAADQPMYLLGYLPRDSRVYVTDKDINITSYALSLSVIEYQTLILRGEMDAAAEALKEVPEDQMGRIAQFLEGLGHRELALEIAPDSEQRFDLALALGRLDIASEIASIEKTESKWKLLGDKAMESWDFQRAEECFLKANDLSSLLLLYSCSANSAGLEDLSKRAAEAGQLNIAFQALWLSGKKALPGLLELLTKTDRSAEATIASLTYCPSQTPKFFQEWRESLAGAGKSRLVKMLAAPPGAEQGDEEADDELWESWGSWLDAEKEGRCWMDEEQEEDEEVDEDEEEEGEEEDDE